MPEPFLRPRPAPSGHIEHLLDFYDSFAAEYDDWAGGVHRRLAARLAELAQPGPGEAVLDVGTGTGLVAHLAAQQVGRRGQVIGIDLSAGMLEMARRRPRVNTRFIGMAAERLVFKEATFDLVTYGLSLADLADPGTSLEEAFRVLKEGGRIAVSSERRSLQTESQEVFFSLIEGLAGQHYMHLPPAPGDRSHLGEPEVLPRILEAAGFQEVQVTEMVTGSRAPDAGRWLEVMAGAGPRPHTLIRALGPRLRARLEAEIESALAPLGEDAFRYHHAFTVVRARKPRGKEPVQASGERGSG